MRDYKFGAVIITADDIQEALDKYIMLKEKEEWYVTYIETVNEHNDILYID